MPVCIDLAICFKPVSILLYACIDYVLVKD